MRDAADDLTATASVLLVGTGSVRHAQEFAAQQQLPFPLVVDPRLLSYRAVGAGKETPFGAVKPSVVAASVVATAQGARQGKIGRHPLVLGATHVIRPGGTVAFAWRNADFADNAPVEDILAVVEGADRA